MTANDPKSRVLCALFVLSQAVECIDIFSLSDEAGLNLYCTLRELVELGEASLLCPRRLTLTVQGLALAVALQGAPRHAELAPKAVSRRRHSSSRDRREGLRRSAA